MEGPTHTDETAEQVAPASRWGEHRAGAAFTFDLDAEQLWRAAGEDGSAFERFSFRGTYGPSVAVDRILEVFDRFDRECTFFVPGRVAEDWPETIQRIHDHGHEIAHHSYSHNHPDTLSADREELEFKRTVDIIEDLVGEPPAGYRGGHSEQTLDLVEETGMSYDASLQDTDIPYVLPERDLVEIPNCLMLDDFVHWGYNMSPAFDFQAGIAPNGPVFDTWRAEFDGLARRGRLFMLTMHPQVIGRASRIDALADLVQHIVESEDVWVGRCTDLADRWRTDVDDGS